MESKSDVIKTERQRTRAPHETPGCCGRHQFDTATEVLSAEHRVIERVLAVLEKLTQRPVETSLEEWQKALDFIRHFADGCHHLKEEKILFPAMGAHGVPDDGGPLGMMLLEHEEGRTYVRSMAAALEMAGANNEAAKKSLLESARAYLRLLREHIQKEDEILFNIANETIPADEQKKLLQAFEEHEAIEMGEGVHEKYLRIAEELEARVA